MNDTELPYLVRNWPTWWAPETTIVWMAAARSGKPSTHTPVVATSCKADLFRSGGQSS